MFGIGMSELLVILLIVFLLFGAKRLPDIAKALGKAIKEFKNPTEEDSGNNSDKNKENKQP